MLSATPSRASSSACLDRKFGDVRLEGILQANGGDGSSPPAPHFRGADLPDLVLAEPPANLVGKGSESGHGYHDDLRDLPKPEGAYHNTFTLNSRDKPYKYSTATAAVFANENAAGLALDSLRGALRGGFETRQVEGLGDDGSVFQNTDPTEPEYRYAWRTRKLLQVFDLVWSRGPASEDTARRFAEKMDGLVPPVR